MLFLNLKLKLKHAHAPSIFCQRKTSQVAALTANFRRRHPVHAEPRAQTHTMSFSPFGDTVRAIASFQADAMSDGLEPQCAETPRARPAASHSLGDTYELHTAIRTTYSTEFRLNTNGAPLSNADLEAHVRKTCLALQERHGKGQVLALKWGGALHDRWPSRSTHQRQYPNELFISEFTYEVFTGAFNPTDSARREERAIATGNMPGLTCSVNTRQKVPDSEHGQASTMRPGSVYVRVVRTDMARSKPTFDELLDQHKCDHPAHYSDTLRQEGLDAYTMGTDAFSMGTDAYTRGTDAFSMRTDAFSMRTDAHSMGTSAYAMRTDAYSMRTARPRNSDGGVQPAQHVRTTSAKFVDDLIDTGNRHPFCQA